MSISISAAGPLSFPRTGTARTASNDGLGFSDIGAPPGQIISVVSTKAASGNAKTAANNGSSSLANETSLNALLKRANTKMAGEVQAPDTTAAASEAAAVASKPLTFDAAFSTADADGDGVLSKDEFQNFDSAVHPGGPHLFEAATGKPVDGYYMFPLMDRAGHGYVTREQAAKFAQVTPDGTLPIPSLGSPPAQSEPASA